MEMESYQVRLAKNEDLEKVLSLYRQASLFLKKHNVDQWQNGYPNQQTFFEDLEKESLYILCNDVEIIGVASILSENDNNYDEIYDGKWLQEGPYVCIHRITVDTMYKGVGNAKLFIDKAVELATKLGYASIRIDTHPDNIAMRKFLKRQGFTKCGTIYLETSDLRIGYEKLLEESHEVE